MAKENKDIGAPLDQLTGKLYKEYGLATLEDRAIPEERDGCITVYRRVLYSAFKMGLSHSSKHVKSARVVGDVIGRYHPHGDKSAYDSLVSLTNRWVQAPMFDGQGNWGSLTDHSIAAYRYTETRLSKFADTVMFNPFYMPVVEYVPTFDGSTVEPLILPALLPILAINGQFGIAAGATANLPSFEYQSVLKVLRAAYEGEDLDAALLYKTLRFRTIFGGFERKLSSKEAKQERMAVFKTVKGRVSLFSDVTFDGKSTVKVTRFAINEMEKALEKLSSDSYKTLVSQARDDSSKGDKYGLLTIVLKKGLKPKEIEKAVAKIDKELSTSKTFNQNRTHRYIDEVGRPQAKVVTKNMVQFFQDWVKWRIELERKACTYWIGEADKEIRRLDLLAQAVDLIDLIVELVKNAKLDEHQVYERYAKKAKCTVDEAKYVLGRPIISLRKLEKQKLSESRKAVVAKKNDLEKRRKKPGPYMAKQLDDFAKLIPTDKAVSS
jgi:DNA gyrase/topoisomerase IV subunit A